MTDHVGKSHPAAQKTTSLPGNQKGQQIVETSTQNSFDGNFVQRNALVDRRLSSISTKHHPSNRTVKPSNMALILPSAFEQSTSSKPEPPSASDQSTPSKPQPRWQRRTQRRQEYLASSLSTRGLTIPRPTSLEATPPQDDAELPIERHIISDSASPHPAKNNATPTHDALPASGLTPTNSGLESPPTDFYSHATTPLTSTLSTSNSWITCSEEAHIHGGANTMASRSAISRRAANPEHEHRQPSKVKIFDAMLSALDRKKKKALPEERSAALQATRGTVLRPHARIRNVLTMTAPSTDSLVLSPAPVVSRHRKLEPRGASEREDFTHLRAFLDANPAKPEDRAQLHEPKSHFDWEESDDESGFQARKKLQPRRMPKHEQAAADEKGAGVETADAVRSGAAQPGSKDIMATLDKFNAFLDEDREAGPRTADSPVQVTKLSGLASKSSREFTPVKRASVLKLFDDPVWVSPTKISAGTSFYSSASSKELGRASSGSSGNTTAESKPSLTSSSTSHDAGPDTPSDAEITRVREYGSRAGLVEKPSLLKKFRSQFQMNSAPVVVIEDGPQRHRNITGGPFESDGFDAPRFVQPPKRRTSTGQISKSDPSDPFIDHIRPKDIGNIKEITAVQGNGVKSPHFHFYANSPSKQDKRLRVDVSSPKPVSTNESGGSKQSPGVALTPSSMSSAAKSSPGGLPMGPWEPDWDDAVKWVRKCERDREAREVKEAKEARREEKRLKKLEAGRDIVRRGSLLGLTPKKPVQDLTEDEFEVFGSAGTTPLKEDSESKRSGLLGGFFTKMLGTREEQETEAKRIERELERHRSLQLLSRSESRNISEPTLEDKTRYENALQKLNGEFSKEPVGSNNAFRSEEESELASAALGLGITAEIQDQLAKRNQAAAQMTYEDFAAMKDRDAACGPAPNTKEVFETASTATIDQGQVGDRSNPCSLETIEEYETEGPELNEYNASEGELLSKHSKGQRLSTDTGNSGGLGGLGASVNSGRARLHSNHKQQASITASVGSNDSIGTHILDGDEDADSDYSQEQEIMPAPLSIRKTRQCNNMTLSPAGHTALSYEPKASDIPMLRVARSSQHLQPAGSNSFIPRRNASFHDRIQEASLQQQSKLGNHPALRGDAVETDEPIALHKSTNGHIHTKSTSELARIDSGIDLGDLHDEGYATGPVTQQEFKSTRDYQASKVKNAGSGNARQHQAPTLLRTSGDSGHNVGDVDVQALRNEVGLAPIRVPSGTTDSPWHPKHPFTWDHEKIMCRDIHTPMNVQPELPEMPHNHPVNLGEIESHYLGGGPVKKQMVDAKMCDNCGTLCCRFANLIITSNITTSRDLAEETVRLKAEQRFNMLRTYHPNGIEEYETFLDCTHCGHSVCPGCANRCTENLCQAIVCTECANESEVCPVHNFI